MQSIEQLKAKYQGVRITSIDELRPIIKEIQELRLYYALMENYRGHSLVDYQLNCGLARYELSPQEFSDIEKKLFKDFSDLATAKVDYIRLPFDENSQNYELRNKWYALFQAQHVGLITRLMDWSIGWETALMFAVENEKHFGKDGTFTVFLVPQEKLYSADRISKVSSEIDPFELKEDMMINTPVYMLDGKFDYIGERRISRQSGRFWAQPIEKNSIPLKEQSEYKDLLIEFIIDGESKKTIKKELEEHGVTLDWHYYRKDENIDDEIKAINSKNLDR